jgi:hypothetical protein
MGLQLPGELVSILGMLGYTWPLADEEQLFQMGQSWLDFGGQLPAPVTVATDQAQGVWSQNTGKAVTAFQKSWTAPDAPAANLNDAATAATMVGVGLMVCAGIVLALKINVIIQLVLLAIEIAEAIATAVATFGASLAEIPIFKEITNAVLDELFNLATNAVLG